MIGLYIAIGCSILTAILVGLSAYFNWKTRKLIKELDKLLKERS